MRHIVLSLCAVLALTACKEKTAAPQETIRPVRAIQIGDDEGFSKRKFPGKAQAADAVTLAFEVAGKLNEIPVSVGDNVEKGQILASLDARDYKNALDTAIAERKRSQAQYQRMKKAALSDAVSKQEVTNAEAAYESAQATVKTKQKAYEDTILRAPYDSVVAAKYIKSFGNVQAKQDAIRLVDPSNIEMVINIPEDIISYAKEGMGVTVEYDAFPDLEISAKVSEVSAEASETTRTFPVTLIMGQPAGSEIKPGMAGKAWRADDEKIADAPEGAQGFEVPVTALASDTDGNSFVWIIDAATGLVQRTLVQTGNITKRGVLVTGLSGGEYIATAGVNVLKEGQKVRIVE